MSMLRPQPYEPPASAIQDRRRLEDLRRLLNRSEWAMRLLTKERDLARWQLVLQRNETARLADENERLRARLREEKAGGGAAIDPDEPGASGRRLAPGH